MEADKSSHTKSEIMDDLEYWRKKLAHFEKTSNCEYCAEHNLDFPEYTVHSMNPIGKSNIISYIESYKRSRT